MCEVFGASYISILGQRASSYFNGKLYNNETVADCNRQNVTLRTCVDFFSRTIRDIFCPIHSPYSKEKTIPHPSFEINRRSLCFSSSISHQALVLNYFVTAILSDIFLSACPLHPAHHATSTLPSGVTSRPLLTRYLCLRLLGEG